MIPLNVKRYPNRKPGEPALGIFLDYNAFEPNAAAREAIVTALTRYGVQFDPERQARDFPFNLRVGSRIEIEHDSKQPGLVMLRYYGQLAEPKPTPAAKPYTDKDDDDEL